MKVLSTVSEVIRVIENDDRLHNRVIEGFEAMPALIMAGYEVSWELCNEAERLIEDQWNNLIERFA